jgi:hypothetical protein
MEKCCQSASSLYAFRREANYRRRNRLLRFHTVIFPAALEWYGMLREGDMLIVGFSPRKIANILYGAISSDGAEELLATLGKHTTGKGCLYIKKLADVDMKVLETLVGKAGAATRAPHTRPS